MRVFVTGASGWIGVPVVKELLSNGHQVLGLVRSDAKAKMLSDLGADVIRGDIQDLDCLRKGAEAADGVIHLAFQADFNDLDRVCKMDRDAIQAMGDVLGPKKGPLVITSGTLMLPLGRTGSEDDEHDSTSLLGKGRGLSETLAKSLVANGVRAVVLRLPPSNHGDGDMGFAAMLVATAREKGVSAYVGDGLNVWPAVHHFDTARLFRLALEKAPAGSTFHAVADIGVPLKDIAEVVGKKLDVPVQSLKPEEAMAHFGFLGMIVPMNNLVSAKKAHDILGWTPQERTLLEDLEHGQYFKN